MTTIEDIKRLYFQNDVCMGELLADISADGLSLEAAFQLYIQAMNYAEKDQFYQVINGEVKCLTEDNGEQAMYLENKCLIEIFLI